MWCRWEGLKSFLISTKRRVSPRNGKTGQKCWPFKRLVEHDEAWVARPPYLAETFEKLQLMTGAGITEVGME
jgi:hypothetical protein